MGWSVSGSEWGRREGAQETVDGERGPLGARLGGVAVGHGMALPVEIQADDRAQQQLGREVRIFMSQQSPARGLQEPSAEAVEHGCSVALVNSHVSQRSSM